MLFLVRTSTPLAYRDYVKGFEAGAGTWFGYYKGGLKRLGLTSKGFRPSQITGGNMAQQDVMNRLSTCIAGSAAASLFKLSPRQVGHALAYAGQQASGVTTWAQDKEHVEKAFVFGEWGKSHEPGPSRSQGARPGAGDFGGKIALKLSSGPYGGWKKVQSVRELRPLLAA